MRRIAPVLLAVALLSSCDRLAERRSPQPQAAEFQRFLPIPANPSAQQVVDGLAGAPWNGYFALDTKTGQLCRTTTIPGKWAPFDTLPSCMNLLSLKCDASGKIVPVDIDEELMKVMDDVKKEK